MELHKDSLWSTTKSYKGRYATVLLLMRPGNNRPWCQRRVIARLFNDTELRVLHCGQTIDLQGSYTLHILKDSHTHTNNYLHAHISTHKYNETFKHISTKIRFCDHTEAACRRHTTLPQRQHVLFFHAHTLTLVYI